MGFVRNLFRRADELTRLDETISRLEADLGRERLRNVELEKVVKSERAAKDKILLRTGDAMLEMAKVRTGYVKDAQVSEHIDIDVEPEAEDMAMYEFAAQEMVKSDIANNIQPLPLEEYVKIIKNDPQRYIL